MLGSNTVTFGPRSGFVESTAWGGAAIAVGIAQAAHEAARA